MPSHSAVVDREQHHGPAGEAGAWERVSGEDLCFQPGRGWPLLQYHGAASAAWELVPWQESQAL